MLNNLLYLKQLLLKRVSLHFKQEYKIDSIYELPEPEEGWLKELLQRESLLTEERIVLLMAMAPHLFPQVLDVFLIPNNELNRPYTEFGGYELTGHSGFLPTGETVAFMLAGTDPVKRIKVTQLFDKTHWFYTSEILELVRENPRDPLLSGKLLLTDKFLNRIMEQYIGTFVGEANLELSAQSSFEKLQHLSGDNVWNIEQARTYPCHSCSALCCRLLFLEKFPLQHFRDLDKARYYLNFPNLEVMLSEDYLVKVYFSGFCGFLERETVTCKIHNKPEQPNLCVHYSPYKCFYKKADADKQHIVHNKLWLNRERLDFLEQELQFNTQREIIGIPAADDLVEVFNDIPYTECHESESIQGEETPAKLLPPCADCNGLCCSTLLFPDKRPETIQDLDFIRYALGYPEVEYLINRNDWIMKVNVRCKYLDTNNRCSVYEQPERPLYCRYYNPHKCTIKPTINQYNLKVKLEQFNLIQEHLEIDNNGRLQDIPSLASLKNILDNSEK